MLWSLNQAPDRCVFCHGDSHSLAITRFKHQMVNSLEKVQFVSNRRREDAKRGQATEQRLNTFILLCYSTDFLEFSLKKKKKNRCNLMFYLIKRCNLRSKESPGLGAGTWHRSLCCISESALPSSLHGEAQPSDRGRAGFALASQEPFRLLTSHHKARFSSFSHSCPLRICRHIVLFCFFFFKSGSHLCFVPPFLPRSVPLSHCPRGSWEFTC